MANRMIQTVPLMPEPGPICRSMFSFGTHTSISPIRMNINGKKVIISEKKAQKFFPAPRPNDQPVKRDISRAAPNRTTSRYSPRPIFWINFLT
ncbi:TPA: hypothetical protein DCG35_06870 [Candidatus Edwardsbacteria bacterium]|nr:hypothetical protein [Candidatus Edwardsbacteria bacterium]